MNGEINNGGFIGEIGQGIFGDSNHGSFSGGVHDGGFSNPPIGN